MYNTLNLKLPYLKRHISNLRYFSVDLRHFYLSMVCRYQIRKIIKNPLNIGLRRCFHVYKVIDMYNNLAKSIYTKKVYSVMP